MRVENVFKQSAIRLIRICIFRIYKIIHLFSHLKFKNVVIVF